MKGYFFVLENPSTGMIQAALPVYLVDSWITGKRLVSIPYATVCDPLVSSDIEFEMLFRAVEKLFSETKSSYVEITALHDWTMVANHKSFKRSTLSQFKNHTLSLSPDLDAIKKNIHKKTRQNLSKTDHDTLTAAECSTISGLHIFYRLYVRTRKKLGLPPIPFQFFFNIWKEYTRTGNIQIVLVYYDKKPIAGQLLLKFKKRIIMEAIGWDYNFRNAKPNDFLYWEIIKLACKEGYKVLDFGRTDAENVGLIDFKRRWGTVESDIPHYFYPVDILKNMSGSGKMKKIFRIFLDERIPDGVARFIGEFCYRLG